MLMSESICCWKYRHGTGNILDNPTPLYISIPWAAFLIWMAVTWLYLRFKPGHTVKYIELEEEERLNKLKEKKGKATPSRAKTQKKKT